jgi:hypothetical protein
MKCEFPEVCLEEATRVGLLQVANPSYDIPGDTGIQKNVLVCEYHSFRWSALWGSWIIDNDAQYGVVFGASGKPMFALESQRLLGEITDEQYWNLRDYALANAESTGEVSLAKRQVVKRPTFTPGDQVVVDPDEPGFIEVDSLPERIDEVFAFAEDVEVNWDIKFQYVTRVVEGTVDEIIPSGDTFLVRLIPASGVMEEYYFYPSELITRLY